jgi:hypothetical protein
MRRALATLMVLLLAIVHAPTQAQALIFPALQLLPFSTNEPGMLFLTGIALLSLARLGRRPH